MARADLIDASLERLRGAASPAERSQQLGALAKAVHTSSRVLHVFDELLAMPGGATLALGLVARMPPPVPPGIVLLAAPILADKSAPVSLRVAAAAKLLASLPDRKEAIGPILRSLTQKLNRTHALERLLALQNRVERCESLDALVAEAEAKVKYPCPKCKARLSRTALAKHLWKRHRTLYDGKHALGAGPFVEAAVDAAAATRAAEGLDRVYLWADGLYRGVSPMRVHQAILSRIGATPADLEPLRKAAAEDGTSLCPACFATLKPAADELPPPAFLGAGRLAGDGFRAAVVARRGARFLAVHAGNELLFQGSDPGPRLTARSLAGRCLLPFAILALLLGAFYPTDLRPVVAVFLATTVGVLAYGIARSLRRTLPNPDDRAIDAAWREIVPKLGRSPTAVRFLMRLARASLGHGTPAERTEPVWDIADHAEELAEKGGAYLQLLGVMRVLQAHDAAVIGKDIVWELVRALTPFLRGELPPVYADAVATALRGADIAPDGDFARLRVLLAVEAFESGLTASELHELGELAPAFGRLLAGAPEWLRQLYAVWRMRSTRPWDDLGSAETVFDFARKSPTASRRILAADPDTLLVARLEKAADEELGAVLVGRKGVVVGGVAVADPDAAVALEGTVLVFGLHRLALRRRVPERTAVVLRQWLRFRTERVLAWADRAEGPGQPERVAKARAAAAVACPMCGVKSVARIGDTATPLAEAPP